MMDAFPLETTRLTLDQPTAADVDDIARFCAEPVFERFMVTPWPYERQHAAGFIEEYVPNGWAQNTEWTWAIREHGAADLLGVISARAATSLPSGWRRRPASASPARSRAAFRTATARRSRPGRANCCAPTTAP